MKPLLDRFIPLPNGQELVEYLVERADMGFDERLYLAVPEAQSRKDAFLLAIHMQAQDLPVQFHIGVFAFGAMLVSLWAKSSLYLCGLL